MTEDLLQLRQDLSRRGEPFALATVVWRRAPSSAQPGNQAIVTAAGKVRGWLSGACADSVVIREARKAMESGEAQLVLLGSPEELAARANDGISLVPMQCQSEGAIELFVEPVLPKPHLVLIGRTPMVRTLTALAKTLGWRTVVVDDRGDPEAHPQADHVITTLDLAAAGVGENSLIVVATQGQYDELAVDKALGTNAAFIGLIASRKRAKAVMDWLRDVDYSDEMLDRVKAPAGLDLGSLKHEEIAVGVLAELVQFNAARKPIPYPKGTPSSLYPEGTPSSVTASPSPVPEAQPTEAEPSAIAQPAATDGPADAVDPVCDMLVDIATARFVSEHEGQTYYFCCPACKKKFEAEPAKYLAPVTA
jgi:xanthine dehydrogenase accessory factor